MNFRLDAEEHLGDTSVLVIRREGRYTTRAFESGSDPRRDDARKGFSVTERQGVTLFAWNRGAVLEDRFMDRIVGSKGCSSTVGTTTLTVSRLVRSRSERLATTASAPAPGRETGRARFSQ